jgi:transposase
MSSVAQPDKGHALIAIGIDPHPDSHTAAALNQDGQTLATLQVGNSPEGLAQLRMWAAAFSPRRYAIEGLGNTYIYPFALALLAAKEPIYAIAPALTSQYRARRGKQKTDRIDAENIARALLANPDLPQFEPAPFEKELQELSRTHRQLADSLKANRMRLMQVSVPELRDVLEAVIKSLEQAAAQLVAEMATLVEQICPALLKLRGVGPIVAATILAESGRIGRFKKREDYAAFAGCAPVTRASGGSRVVRVNPGGNRRLNWALHIIVRTRLRTEVRSQAYRTKKLAEGKSQREVLRALKTHVCREIYRTLRIEHASAPPFPATSAPKPVDYRFGPCS